MVDLQVVCSMCGDVGFPDKLFHCSNGCNRFQHSYCSNYYSETSEPIEVCDWCKVEETNVIPCDSSRILTTNNGNRSSTCTGGRINHHNEGKEDSSEGRRRKSNKSASPSPRTATRRYKLLKDVMC